MDNHVNPETGEIEYPFVRNPYNYDRQAVSVATGLVCTMASKTQQQFKDECDINVILERFGVTGQLPLTARQPMSGDFTGISDYHQALLSLEAANANFLLLPAKVRDQFNQDPRVFVDFCLNPANAQAVAELGLSARPPAPTLAEISKASKTAQEAPN
ncbi:MAG: internal scaffolding protein [Microvirus sp.]|nr:MAG: internal scaffolding protein [Microvirus sp.]